SWARPTSSWVRRASPSSCSTCWRRRRTPAASSSNRDGRALSPSAPLRPEPPPGETRGGATAAKPREVYVDAFRGLMALVMVQGHVCDTLLTPAARAAPLYVYQTIFHGSTAPGFLFASGFVAGLPRAPLSWKASVRRARRLLFVLGVGYALHLPYFSLLK